MAAVRKPKQQAPWGASNDHGYGKNKLHATSLVRRSLRLSQCLACLSASWTIRKLLLVSALAYVLSLLYLSHNWVHTSAALYQIEHGSVHQLHYLRTATTVNHHRLLIRTGYKSDDGSAAVTSTQTVWAPHEYECLRWLGTDDDGETLTGESRACWQRVRGGEAGFCEVRNASSGQIVQLMRTISLSLKDEVRFTCRFAQRFSDFRHLASSYKHDPPMALDHRQARGIVMAVYEDILASAYASIRQLRDVGCVLPIELWSRYDEVHQDHAIIRALKSQYGPVTLRVIHDDRVHGFYIKTHAVYYSSFGKVLLLDADNFALNDPSFLFDSMAFRRHGAVFWPDFWHPGNTIFNVHAQSLLWELLGLEYVEMGEQESGQVLIDRTKSRHALERLMFLATQKPNILNKLLLVWGDKDLFRLAWLSVGKSFYFNDRRLPGALGILNKERTRFCGMSMVQYDVESGNVLFLHRNTIKLTGKKTTPHIWRVLQEYALDASPPPTIQSFSGAKLFNTTSCFGIKRFQHPQQVGLVETREASTVQELVGLEDKLTAYAYEAVQLVTKDEESA